jgi:arylsulfatase A-like enzyme
LNGYRLYDIAVQTGKTARSAAAIGTEMVLGQLSFGAVLMAGSIFGLEVLGLQGVILVDAFFLALIAGGIALLARPTLFRKLGGLLPPALRSRLQTTLDAVCAYQGKAGLVTVAALLGMGTHAFNNLIYVCTARALGVELSVGQVFFVSAMQIFSTLLPASVNGIGVREATAVALYTRMGVPASVSFLVPAVGFAVEMAISAFGGLVFLLRRVGYKVVIQVDDPEREQIASTQLPSAPRESWPRIARGAAVGFAGGLLGGMLLGVGEAIVVLASGSGGKHYGVLAYGGAVYGLACALAGLGLGLAFAWSGRLMKRAAVSEPAAYGGFAALLASGGAFAIGAFRVRRDLFDELLKWKSAQGLLVLAGCLLAAAVLYLLIATLARTLVARTPLRVLLRASSAALLLGALFALALAWPRAQARPALHAEADGKPAPAEAGNVLFIVIDTLRADHLPLWGYRGSQTPNLDAFARDAIRFEHAFANASWTRPSFASLLTGRYPASHRTTLKSDSLPSEIVTLAEAMQDAGYSTHGVVTNYNVAPFFNFHQGFDQYRYLEPDFVLGAGDTEAKLLFVQLLRQKIEGYRASRGQVEPGSAYQDAEQVNAEIARMLDAKPRAPFLLFAAYMDPHDPYYPHPYDGTGYARAAHQKPDPSDAARMRKLYDGEIEFWDAHFGELVADLKRRGLYDDLTVVITSDHGEEFMDHGGFWHGTTLYDEQIRVPLLLKLPRGERGGSVVTHWVESIDVMPSLLQRNGIAVPKGVQGKDLLQASDSVYAEEDHEGNVLRSLRLRRGQSELKLIEANEDNPRGLQPFELFRMDQDPGELVNLARDDAATLGVAVSNLEQRARETELGAAARQQLNVRADPAAMQKLRALGYAGGDENKAD